MNLELDHIVHYVKDPEFMQKSFSNLGFSTVKGGRHLNWGTYNSLCYFSNGCYLEWIGIDNIDIAKNSENPLIKQIVEDEQLGEGFTQVAFRTNEINLLATRLKEKGQEVIGPVPGCRRREDGSLIEWSMLFLAQAPHECRYPFFIQWGEEDAERRAQIQPLTEHKVGLAKVKAIYFAVQDSKTIADEWGSLLDIEKMISFKIENWNAIGYQLDVGGIEVNFCEPIGDGLLEKEMIKRGQKPFMCEISNINISGKQEISGGRYSLKKQ
ncbi:VOC family protein [Bacillus massilinigeriensis]|uniref:VOC family protein n=1 Tax=Bacillus massilionigeriensis TaxID=1805475 RepID=UPI000A0441B9|nr:VOC family protein [Bacillus massilionigeriensis]